MEDHACVCAQLESIEKIPIAGSGHFMKNDNPDEFYRRLASL